MFEDEIEELNRQRVSSAAMRWAMRKIAAEKASGRYVNEAARLRSLLRRYEQGDDEC